MKRIIVLLMCTMCVVSSFSKQCINVPEGERFDYDLLTYQVAMPNVVPFRITNTDSTITFWAFKCELDEPFDTTQRMNNVKQMDWFLKLRNKMQWDMNHYFKVATFKSFEEYKNFIFSLSSYMEANFDAYEKAPAYKLDGNIECYPAYNYRWISLAVHPLYLYVVFVDKSNPTYFGQVLRLDLDALEKRLKNGKWKDMQKKPSRVAPVEQTTQSKVEPQKSDSVVAPAVHSEISTKNDEVSAKTESSETIIAEEPKKEAEPVAAPAENVAAVETVAKEEPKAVKEEVEKEEKAKEEKVKEEKVKKERGPKLNERKRNGYGIFVDAGGALFEGPRLGLEMRFNRCIPSVFVGYPNFGYFFKKDHEDISDLQSISAGAGVKGLVPMRIGGFYAGGTLLYERYAGETNPSTVESQKVLYNDGSVLANIGFRFQTKFNLFFNLGFMAGPNFSFGNARFSNPLNYDYTPKYQSEDMKISLKKMGELSIGYEF